MAEECVNVPMVTDVTMPPVVGLRRHSSGKASSENNEEKVVPHYLRASTGSCHDFCKYGKKLALEAKRSSIPKKAERKALHRSSEMSFGGITMITVVKCCESVDKIAQEKSTEVSEVLVNKNKTSLIRGKPSSVLPKSHISSTPKTRWLKVSSSFELDTNSKPTSKRVRDSSISTSKKEEPQLKSTSERVKTHPKSTSKVVVKTSSKSTSTETRASLKLSSPLRASMSSKSSGKRLSGINMQKSLKTESHDVMNESKARKVEPEEHSNKVQEKTLYVIKVENTKQTFQSDQNANQDIELSPPHSLSSSAKFSSSSVSQVSSQEDQEETKYPTSELEEVFLSGKHEYIEKEETFEVEEKGKPQKDDGVIVHFEDKDCEKLRVKLEETEIEKTSPKKLAFKRGKVLEVNATDGDNIVAEKVVLRHQDMEGKKDGKVLLNNVIEERASKLVETQRSKVKALVDAFETIISLHGKKDYAANSVN